MTAQKKETFLKEYTPPAYLVDRIDLRVELDPRATLVQSRLQCRANTAAGGPLVLDGERLQLLRVAIDGVDLGPEDYTFGNGQLVIPHPPAAPFEVAIHTRIDPEGNTALEGLYRSSGNYCTQCEAEGFRTITCFPDRPDVMSVFTTTVVGDRTACPVLLANGNCIDRGDLPDGRHWATWHDPFPKPSYLFALVAGDLVCLTDTFTTRSGRSIDLRIYIEPRNRDKCDHAMRALKKAMRWDEERFGREYDLDTYMIVAVDDFNMGAMENKGLNVFNSKYVLALPETATDTDYEGIEAVIAHEYFHNWTGNRITCRDWFQLSLKEGFTVYRDQEFSADQGSRGVKRIEDVRLLRSRQFPEDAGPMAHPVRPDSYIEINNFYTATVYEKGAELVRMQAGLLGPERFRKGTDLYFERFDGQAVTTDDFVACMEQAGGLDLTQFRRWYAQAGTPVLECADHYDADAGTYTLEIRQHTPATPGQADKQPLHIPFAVGLLDAQGRDLPLRLAGESAASEPTAAGVCTRMLELRAPVERFTFVGLAARPVPSLLRGFSAPVRLRYPYSDADLTFLMAHDSDGFNRWDAAQTLAQRLLLRMVEEEALSVPDSFVEAFRQALKEAPVDASADTQADPALLAEVLTLPSEGYLADQMDCVDVDGIHRARETLAATLGALLREDLLAVYERHWQPGAEAGDYDLSPAAAGRRALRNCVLGYLGQAPDAGIVALAQRQFDTANNMTDVIAALRVLLEMPVDVAGDAGERALAAFYRRWSQEQLVLDKWFALQAQSSRPDTLARVKGLMKHPQFSLANPNRVRALIGAFASGNPLRFHAEDGAGYGFLADRILELDPLNPQIAARLLHPMTRWRRYDPGRQALMQRQLERILEVDGLSSDVYEVVSRSLGKDEG
ncbi:aminopeptidase N [Thiohalocapsa marina]|uniref:aminopeptidase N n=1 Tax=Thiohalocapsa marina TaxID=424902 RepID=UPI0036DF5E9E